MLTDGFNPTAVFACNDDMAAATMAMAHRKGLDVPRDLAIAGFDDTPLATMIWPELTTVRRPISDMAREAVRLLIEQMQGQACRQDPTPWSTSYWASPWSSATSPARSRRKRKS